MNRLTDFVEMELEIFCAVISRRIRSLVLLAMAIVAPPILQISILSFAEKLPFAEFGEEVHAIVALLGLVLMFKLFVLAIHTYLKDRAAFLRF